MQIMQAVLDTVLGMGQLLSSMNYISSIIYRLSLLQLGITNEGIWKGKTIDTEKKCSTEGNASVNCYAYFVF